MAGGMTAVMARILRVLSRLLKALLISSMNPATCLPAGRKSAESGITSAQAEQCRPAGRR